MKLISNNNKQRKSNFMKYFKIFVITATIFLFGNVSETFATHIVGGNMTYRSLGNNQYEISLTLRRDCFLGSPEAEFDDPAYIGIYNEAGTYKKTIYGGQLSLNFNPDDTLNNIIISDCGFEGSQVCVHETTYRDTIVLPNSADGYLLAYLRCCRNASVENIEEPLETGSTYFVRIPPQAIAVENNSAVFKEWPYVYICGGQQIDFDHSAIDPDGDSLVYKLCNPITGLTREKNTIGINNTFFPIPLPLVPVEWRNGYSLQNMLGVANPSNYLKINPNTGLLTGIPRNEAGQFLVGICVEEYRDGVFVGRVRRDFQYNVRVCTPPPFADFDAPDTQCDGLEVSFENQSIAGTKFEWFFDWPNPDLAFFSTEENPTFTFPQGGSYQVRLRTIRNTDGCEDDTIRTITIFPENLIPSFESFVSSCEDDGSINITLQETTSANNPDFNIIEHSWLFIQNNDTTAYSGGLVTVKPDSFDFEVIYTALSDVDCSDTISQFFHIEDFYPKIDFDVALFECPTDGIGGVSTIIFNNNSAEINPFAVIDSIIWNINGDIYNQDSFSLDLDVDAPLFVSLEILFTNGCTISEVRDLTVQDLLPQANYDITQLGCDDDFSTNILITYNSNDDKGIAVNTIFWDISIGGVQTTSAADSVYLTIPKDSVMTLTLAILFENGCIDSLSQSFIPGPYATINLVEGPVEICPGNPVNLVLNPYPELTYTWSPEDGLDLTDPSNPIASPMVTTTYFVTVTDGICTVSDSVTVNVLDGLIIDVLGDEHSCDGDYSLTATGGFGAGVYEWSNDNQFTDIVFVGNNLEGTLETDSITFYIRWSSNECDIAGDSITVHDDRIQLITFDPQELCRLDTTEILVFSDNDDHELSFVWEYNSHIVSGDSTSSPLIGVGADETEPFDLIFSVENQYGCKLNDTLTMIIVESPVVDFVFTRESCDDLTICFEIVGEYNAFPGWNFGDLTTEEDKSFMNPACYTYPEGGTYAVNLTNLTSNCAFPDVMKNISIVDTFDFTALSESLEACLGDTILFSVPDDYLGLNNVWCNINGDTLNVGDTYEHYVNGNDTLTLKVTDDTGCSGSHNIEIIDLTQADISIIHTVTECGELAVCFEVEGQYLGDILWDFGDLNTEADTSVLDSVCYVYPASGTYTISLTNISDFCGFGTITKEITIRDTFLFPGLDDIEICLNDTATFVVPVEYQDYLHVWCTVNGDSISNENELEVIGTEDQTYILKVTDDNGCTASKTVALIITTFDFTINEPVVYCENVTSIVSVDSPNENYTYFWSPEDCIVDGQGTDEVEIKNVDDKTVTLEITDNEKGCVTTASFDIEINYLDIEIDIQPNLEIFLGSEGVLSIVNPNPDYTYEWNNGEIGTEITVSPEENTTYCVIATDLDGCTGEECIEVTVLQPECDETDIFIPNAFTPNGDGNNDVLFVRSNYVDAITITIYNRWGQEVFKTIDKDTGWDGTFNNELLQPDSYAYYIEVVCTNQETYTKRGNVTLIR
jgi:gliding motility-associated-like protein